MTEQLSNQSDIATERTNDTGNRTPILTFNPENGTTLVIQGMVAAGSEPGFPVFADLNQADGSDMPEDTELVFEYDRSGSDQTQVVTYPLKNIRQYNALSVNDQQNKDYIDQTKIRFKNTEQAINAGKMPKIQVRDIDDLHVSVTSSAEIDWSQSRLYIDRNAVQVV